MSSLQKIIYLKREQYEALLSNNNTGQIQYGGVTLTGVQDDNIYFITDETVSASDLGNDFILPVDKGGTGRDRFTVGSVPVGNGTAAMTELAATNQNTANTLVKRDSTGSFYAGTVTATTATIGSMSLTSTVITGVTKVLTNGYMLLGYKVSGDGVTAEQWSVGTSDRQGVIRTAANQDLLHSRGSATSTIIDTGNYKSYAWARPSSITGGWVVISSGTDGSTTLREIADISTAGTNPAASTKLITSNTLLNYKGTTSVSTVGTITSGTWNGSTIGIAYGGTGTTTHTTNRLVWSQDSTKIQAGYHYASTTAVGVNTVTAPAENFYVNGTSYLNGAATVKGNITADGNNIILYNSATSGDSPSLIFKRSSDSTLTDWRIHVTGGKLTFSTAANASTWTERAYFKDTSGNLVLNNVYFKVGSDDTTNYISSTTYTGNAASATESKWLMNRGTNVAIENSNWSHGQTGAGGANIPEGRVWDQKWTLTSSNTATWDNNGTAKPITDTADLVFWLSQTTTANQLWVNMAIDGYIYSLSGFKGKGDLLTNLNASNLASGTVAIARGGTGLSKANPHNVLIGPKTGTASAAPTWRAIDNADLPGSGQITIGGVTAALGGSISLENMGLSSAMHFKGTVSSVPDATANTTFNSYAAGDVILGPNDKEYVYNKGSNATGSSWIELGSESSFKIKQIAVSDPSVGSTAATSFIATIGQDAEGVITATKSPLPVGTSSVTGIVLLGAENGAATYGHTHSTTLTQTGSSAITLAANTVYTLTAGGNSVAFTTPPDADTIPAAYCDTASGTKAKVAKCTDYEETANTWIHIIMKNANTNTAATLSINGKTAKAIKVNGVAPAASGNNQLKAGSYLAFYDGSNYLFRTDGKLPGDISGDAATVSSHTVSADVPSDAVFTDHYDWDDITNKPSDFTPSSHTHGDISNTGTLGSASYGVATDANKKIIAIDLSVSAPNASGTATTFVTSVTQSSQGKISVARSTVPAATTQVAGIVKLGTGASDAAKGNHTHSYLSNANAGASDRPIYITSNAATATTYRMAGTNTTATTGITYSDDLNTGIWYVTGIPAASNPANPNKSITDGVIIANKYSNSWISEIYQDYRSGQIAIRGKNNGTWQDWRKVLDSINYSDYAVKKSDGVTAVTWDSTNNKLTRTINGTAGDVVTIATIKTAIGSITPTSHSHGNIANGGTIAVSTSSTIANGDTIVISTSANSGKLTRASITFDASTTTEYLNKKGSWGTPPDTKNTAGATATTSKIYLVGSTTQTANPQTYSTTYVHATDGVLSAKSFEVNYGTTDNKVTLQWNNTDSALEFVFA